MRAPALHTRPARPPARAVPALLLRGDDFEHVKGALVASIGPVTSETAREHGLEVGIEASPHTIPALVEALKVHYARG